MLINLVNSKVFAKHKLGEEFQEVAPKTVYTQASQDLNQQTKLRVLYRCRHIQFNQHLPTNNRLSIHTPNPVSQRAIRFSVDCSTQCTLFTSQTYGCKVVSGNLRLLKVTDYRLTQLIHRGETNQGPQTVECKRPEISRRTSDKNILLAIKALMLRVHTTTRTNVWGGNRLPGASEAEG